MSTTTMWWFAGVTLRSTMSPSPGKIRLDHRVAAYLEEKREGRIGHHPARKLHVALDIVQSRGGEARAHTMTDHPNAHRPAVTDACQHPFVPVFCWVTIGTRLSPVEHSLR
jgi:hypothetical protein